jgi:hypothetical protein
MCERTALVASHGSVMNNVLPNQMSASKEGSEFRNQIATIRISTNKLAKSIVQCRTCAIAIDTVKGSK